MGQSTKIIKIIIPFIIAGFLLTSSVNEIYGSSETIQQYLDEACHMSKSTSLSVSIVTKTQEQYFFCGYANQELGLKANEETLYELASVSKSFTGAAILLLEERGLLSLEDSIEHYLPWLSFSYQGQSYDLKNITLNHFLTHQSGLTNKNHMKYILEGNSDDLLHQTIENLIGTELAFEPGSQTKYATINYDVLGLIIETVTNERFEDFMSQQIFVPLGLSHTTAYQEVAQATQNLAQGYRLSFLSTQPYDPPLYGGNKPAGYIISNAIDMALWMKIQLGLVSDIAEEFSHIIDKSHQINHATETTYGAGWFIHQNGSMIEHPGVNPSFASQIVLYHNEQIGISLLSNSNHINLRSVYDLKLILDGHPKPKYIQSDIQQLDLILSILSLLFLGLGVFQLIRNVKKTPGRKYRFRSVWVVMTLGLILLCVLFPSFFGYTWSTLLIWQPYSILSVWLTIIFWSVTIVLANLIRDL